jgi:hypothetical protein
MYTDFERFKHELRVFQPVFNAYFTRLNVSLTRIQRIYHKRYLACKIFDKTYL